MRVLVYGGRGHQWIPQCMGEWWASQVTGRSWLSHSRAHRMIVKMCVLVCRALSPLVRSPEFHPWSLECRICILNKFPRDYEALGPGPWIEKSIVMVRKCCNRDLRKETIPFQSSITEGQNPALPSLSHCRTWGSLVGQYGCWRTSHCDLIKREGNKDGLAGFKFP